jgi:hypothetical protein
MSFVSNGGKFKLYTVLNGLIFPTPTQPRISFERTIHTPKFRNGDVRKQDATSRKLENKLDDTKYL